MSYLPSLRRNFHSAGCERHGTRDGSLNLWQNYAHHYWTWQVKKLYRKIARFFFFLFKVCILVIPTNYNGICHLFLVVVRDIHVCVPLHILIFFSHAHDDERILSDKTLCPTSCEKSRVPHLTPCAFVPTRTPQLLNSHTPHTIETSRDVFSFFFVSQILTLFDSMRVGKITFFSFPTRQWVFSRTHDFSFFFRNCHRQYDILSHHGFLVGKILKESKKNSFFPFGTVKSWE